MQNRFLNNNDYTAIVTEEALQQLIRNKEDRLEQAEEAAETSIVEYLAYHYEVEQALEFGKMINQYNPQITYPPKSYFYYDNEICETLRTITGRKYPVSSPYWELVPANSIKEDSVEEYKQLKTYSPGDYVLFNNNYYVCLEYNGFDFNNIRIPGLEAWAKVEDVAEWEANNPYEQWQVVKWNEKFYALISTEDIDLTLDPHQSENWGLIADYDPNYNEYELSEHEYVVYQGEVFYPVMNVNSDIVELNSNIKHKDPRNKNLKKHMLRIAVYELHKLISPNNISSSRITDYETSIKWLQDAAAMRINPQIPRKLDKKEKPKTSWQLATFQKEFDPYENPWLT